MGGFARRPLTLLVDEDRDRVVDGRGTSCVFAVVLGLSGAFENVLACSELLGYQNTYLDVAHIFWSQGVLYRLIASDKLLKTLALASLGSSWAIILGRTLSHQSL